METKIRKIKENGKFLLADLPMFRPMFCYVKEG